MPVDTLAAIRRQHLELVGQSHPDQTEGNTKHRKGNGIPGFVDETSASQLRQVKPKENLTIPGRKIMAKEKKTAERVTVSLLLKKEARNKESMHAVQANAAKLGLEPTSQGRVSLCFQTTPEKFQELFGVEAKPVEAQAPTERDFGAPSGFEVESALPIPEALAAHTESISVEPPATRLADQAQISRPSTESISHGKTKEEDDNQEKNDQEEDDQEEEAS